MSLTDKLFNIYQQEIDDSRTKIDELHAAQKVDAGDGAENSAQDEVRHQLYDEQESVETLLIRCNFLNEVKPLTNEFICLGSMFSCDYNGKHIEALLGTFVELKYLDTDGIVVFDINSEVGKSLLAKRNGNSVHIKDVHITNITLGG